nr:hypothetical protein [Cytophagales bacterium]
MKGLRVLVFVNLLGANAFGQIDMNDSSAQVIGYWDLNETQSYLITQENIRVRGDDTTSREFYKYLVDMTIVDSTENSYLIDWFYSDYDVQTDNELIKKLAAVAEDMTVRIRTDELGAFQEVINWEEVRAHILKGTEILAQDTKDIPNMDEVIKQLEGMYSTKESIELGAVKDMRQFFTFHGAKYEYGKDYNADMKVANLRGGEPFDAKVTVWLDELNPDDNNFIIRMQQTVDSEQLTNATFEYLVNVADMKKAPAPTKEEMPTLTNDTWTASRIHGSGWIIYSVETKEVRSEGGTNTEERIIEIQ